MTIQIQGMTVRFRRTIQVTQYEPAECEITLHGVAPEGDTADLKVDLPALIKSASEEVHLSLGLPKDTKLPARPKAVGNKREASTEIPGSVVTHNGTRVEGGKTTPVTIASSQPADAGDIPEVVSTPAKVAPTQNTAGDIPEVVTPAAKVTAPVQAPTAQVPAGDAEKTKALSNLSNWIGDFVKASTITAAEVKTIYPKYGIASVNNLRPEQKEPFYNDVRKLLEDKAAKAADAASL